MQKIKFTTVSAGTIEISDVNTSVIDGEWHKLQLNDFDGNSQGVNLQSSTCIDMPGQRTFSCVPTVKTITATISFAAMYYSNNVMLCSGEYGMHELRREVLLHFPLGEAGTLEYTNDCGTWKITARLDTIPVVTRKEGYLSECTLCLTADYPYWCRDVTCDPVIASYGNPATITAPSGGDIISPVSALITCTESLTTRSEAGAVYFDLADSVRQFYRAQFVKPLSAGEQLKFSLQYNNEFIVQYKASPSAGWMDANEYLYYTEVYHPPENVPAATTFTFTVATAGALSITLTCHNLFTAI